MDSYLWLFVQFVVKKMNGDEVMKKCKMEECRNGKWTVYS
jgi:hypothetical protein